MANVMTPPFRVSYPNVFKAKFNKLSNKDEYSVVALFPKDADLSVMKAAAEAAVEEKWGKDKTKWPQKLKSPFRDQGERADEETGNLPNGYEKGAVFINLKSKQRPGVVDAQVNDIINEADFYAGCWARATVSCYAYDQAGNKGVAFGLTNLQKVKDGEPLGGRPRATDDFAPIAGAAKVGSVSDLF